MIRVGTNSVMVLKKPYGDYTERKQVGSFARKPKRKYGEIAKTILTVQWLK